MKGDSRPRGPTHGLRTALGRDRATDNRKQHRWGHLGRYMMCPHARSGQEDPDRLRRDPGGCPHGRPLPLGREGHHARWRTRRVGRRGRDDGLDRRGPTPARAGRTRLRQVPPGHHPGPTARPTRPRTARARPGPGCLEPRGQRGRGPAHRPDRPSRAPSRHRSAPGARTAHAHPPGARPRGAGRSGPGPTSLASHRPGRDRGFRRRAGRRLRAPGAGAPAAPPGRGGSGRGGHRPAAGAGAPGGSSATPRPPGCCWTSTVLVPGPPPDRADRTGQAWARRVSTIGVVGRPINLASRPGSAHSSPSRMPVSIPTTNPVVASSRPTPMSVARWSSSLRFS